MLTRWPVSGSVSVRVKLQLWVARWLPASLLTSTVKVSPVVRSVKVMSKLVGTSTWLPPIASCIGLLTGTNTMFRREGWPSGPPTRPESCTTIGCSIRSCVYPLMSVVLTSREYGWRRQQRCHRPSEAGERVRPGCRSEEEVDQLRDAERRPYTVLLVVVA